MTIYCAHTDRNGVLLVEEFGAEFEPDDLTEEAALYAARHPEVIYFEVEPPKPTSPLGDEIRRLIEVGDKPVYKTTPEEKDFFDNHPLRNTKALIATSTLTVLLAEFAAWLDSKEAS